MHDARLVKGEEVLCLHVCGRFAGRWAPIALRSFQVIHSFGDFRKISVEAENCQGLTSFVVFNDYTLIRMSVNSQ